MRPASCFDTVVSKLPNLGTPMRRGPELTAHGGSLAGTAGPLYTDRAHQVAPREGVPAPVPLDQHLVQPVTGLLSLAE